MSDTSEDETRRVMALRRAWKNLEHPKVLDAAITAALPLAKQLIEQMQRSPTLRRDHRTVAASLALHAVAAAKQAALTFTKEPV